MKFSLSATIIFGNLGQLLIVWCCLGHNLHVSFIWYDSGVDFELGEYIVKFITGSGKEVLKRETVANVWYLAEMKVSKSSHLGNSVLSFTDTVQSDSVSSGSLVEQRNIRIQTLLVTYIWWIFKAEMALLTAFYSLFYRLFGFCVFVAKIE